MYNFFLFLLEHSKKTFYSYLGVKTYYLGIGYYFNFKLIYSTFLIFINLKFFPFFNFHFLGFLRINYSLEPFFLLFPQPKHITCLWALITIALLLLSIPNLRVFSPSMALNLLYSTSKLLLCKNFFNVDMLFLFYLFVCIWAKYDFLLCLLIFTFFYQIHFFFCLY